MLKTFFLLLLCPGFAHSQQQKILLQQYSFLGIDEEVRKLKQSNDTLYELHCYFNGPCQSKPENHYKIISASKGDEFTILKLEKLDTIPLTNNPYPATRYCLIALKQITDTQLGYLPLTFGLTRKQIDSMQTNTLALQGKFFFTFYSDRTLKEFSSLQKISTKEDAQKVIAATKDVRFKNLAESYSKTKTNDMYGSGFSAEIITKACLMINYNPIGAGSIINQLMKR